MRKFVQSGVGENGRVIWRATLPACARCDGSHADRTRYVCSNCGRALCCEQLASTGAGRPLAHIHAKSFCGYVVPAVEES